MSEVTSYPDSIRKIFKPRPKITSFVRRQDSKPGVSAIVDCLKLRFFDLQICGLRLRILKLKLQVTDCGRGKLFSSCGQPCSRPESWTFLSETGPDFLQLVHPKYILHTFPIGISINKTFLVTLLYSFIVILFLFSFIQTK